MVGQGIHFFCTRLDVLTLGAAVSGVHYARCGLFSTMPSTPLPNLDEAPEIGYLSIGDQTHAPSFLVAKATRTIIVRPIPQAYGGVMYAVDQKNNSDTVLLNTGGLFGNECMIAGSLTTISSSEESEALFAQFKRVIRTDFIMVGSFYLGKEAKGLFDQGMRFTQSLGAPASSDLRLPRK